MNTQEIAKALAAAAKQFPLLGEIHEQDLLDVVKWELGHEGVLDDFQPYAGHWTMATGPAAILHIISGNTPHAGLQSLMRGLLLKSRNFCKIPSAGLPEIGQFRDALPEELQSHVEISTDLPAQWIEQCGAIIVFGDDDTVDHFRWLARENHHFIAHGHKISFGIIFDDTAYESIPHAARDASLYDQQGCLSPHVFYVDESTGLNAHKYASLLAFEMEKFNQGNPRAQIGAQEAAEITGVRADYEFRSANSGDVDIWKSATGTDWTVIFDKDPTFSASCLNRVIFVKPLAKNFEESVAAARSHLSTIALWPSTPANARRVRGTGASRICRIGRMQEPRFTWHQDGGQNLAPLVRWIDWEE